MIHSEPVQCRILKKNLEMWEWTLSGHIAEHMEHFNIPNLQKLGIANLKTVKGRGPGGCADGTVHKILGGEQRQRYDDRPLGDDGDLHDEAF